MDRSRFKEYSGMQSEAISLEDTNSLKILEQLDTILLYETVVKDPPGSIVRVGKLENIRVRSKGIHFKFKERGRLPRQYIEGNEEGLQIGQWELTRTHWAIKDGSLPQEVIDAIITPDGPKKAQDAWANRSGSQPYHLRVVHASPSDVQKQRDIVAHVVDELNRILPATHGVALNLFRWEIDSRPGFHADGGQAIIDQVLKIQDADLLIGIFWHRFGSQLSSGKTGTEHEIETAIGAKAAKGTPEIMLYFCQRNVSLVDIDPDQVKSLRTFQATVQKQGLYRVFDEDLGFERAIREHIIGWATDLVAQRSAK